MKTNLQIAQQHNIREILIERLLEDKHTPHSLLTHSLTQNGKFFPLKCKFSALQGYRSAYVIKAEVEKKHWEIKRCQKQLSKGEANKFLAKVKFIQPLLITLWRKWFKHFHSINQWILNEWDSFDDGNALSFVFFEIISTSHNSFALFQCSPFLEPNDRTFHLTDSLFSP